MGACVKISKYMLFLFNILFWIAGGVALGLGIYFRVKDDANTVVEVAGVTFYYAGCYVMITVGSVMFVLGFLGCCGAIKENRCLLGIYFAFLFIIFIVQLGVGIWGLVNQDTIEQDIQNALNESTPLDPATDEAYTQSVISMENRFQCCGLVNGCSDWKDGVAYGCACKLTEENCEVVPGECSNAESNPLSGIYTQPCYNSIYQVIIDNLVLVAGIAIGIGLMEIFGMIFVIVICRNKKKEYSSY
ncbi:tetraspanin-8-like [Styela clava]